MKLSSALVDVALELVDLKAKNIRQVHCFIISFQIFFTFTFFINFILQVETEKAKLKAEGPNSRLDVLINKKAEVGFY